MDRAMIVFKFFMEKSDVIGSEMKKLFNRNQTFIEVQNLSNKDHMHVYSL